VLLAVGLVAGCSSPAGSVATRGVDVTLSAPPPPVIEPRATDDDAGARHAEEQHATGEPALPPACPREPPLELESPPWASNDALLGMVADPSKRVGSASIGRAARGALYGGVELAESEGIVHAGGYAWGTANSVRALERAVRQVRACFPDTPRLFVGDLSREHGGWLGPHASHQAGLDADVGYFYVGPPLWYQRATAKNLDVPRTRLVLKTLIEGGNVEMIFIDRSVQNLLRRQPNEPTSDDLLDETWFEGPLRREAIIRHAWGHATHFHVRFKDPDATALGERLVQLLPAAHPLRRVFPGTAKR